MTVVSFGVNDSAESSITTTAKQHERGDDPVSGHYGFNTIEAFDFVYIWRIQTLKSELANAPLSAAQGLQYVLAIGVADAALDWILSPTSSRPFNVWDHLGSLGMLIAMVVGVLSCYRANGGDGGLDFVPRLISLSWVLGIRTVFLAFIPMVVAVVAYESWRGFPRTGTTLLQMAATLLVAGGFFIRLREHFRSLARKR